MQTEGFLIVVRPAVSLALYAASDMARRSAQALQQLRGAFADLPPERYRGISRHPLMAYPSLDSGIIRAFEETGCDMKSDATARRVFCEILGELDQDADAQIDEDLLPTLADARKVLSLVDTPSRWEIIRASRGENAEVPTLLGFDIGYWGGDHFSLIADTIVAPCWHPPALDDLAELRQALVGLNENLLFRTRDEAERFREYYRSKPWAETEDSVGEFCIIRVDGVD